MQRPITGFATDAAGDPIALLSCGHPQHVRHQPPMTNRPWVLTAAGREAMLGRPLNCVRCDRLELPADFVAYKRTPLFTADSMPDGLRRDHATTVGVWARIHVLEGRLRYRVERLQVEIELSPEHDGVIVPELMHSVEPLGAVRFYVEFYRRADR